MTDCIPLVCRSIDLAGRCGWYVSLSRQ